MSIKLDNASNIIGDHLDAIRRQVFKRECRWTMRLTFIARDPTNPEADMFVSEDDIEGVIDLLRRTVDRGAPARGTECASTETAGLGPQGERPGGEATRPAEPGEIR